MNTSAGITRGSDLATGLVGYTCRSATLELFLDYGVGFAIPAWSQDIINVFLSVFHAKPIARSYSKSLGTLPIQSVSDAIPASCAAKPS